MEWRYRTTFSLTSALDGVGGQRHATAALTLGKTRYPLYRSRSGRVRKISPPNGIRSPDRPARSGSLYRLSYPGPQMFTVLENIAKLGFDFRAGEGETFFFRGKERTQLTNDSYRQMSCYLRFTRTLWCSGQYRCVVLVFLNRRAAFGTGPREA